jgi:hypothetical protein
MKYEKDYYQTLGVQPNATSTEISRAYHRLAILNHPDRNPNPQATIRMQEINEAYSVIGNRNNRRKYDSERISSTADALFQNKDTPTTMNLQQIFAEDTIPPIGIFSILIISIFSAVSVGFLGWSLATLNFEFIILTITVEIIGSLSIYGILSIWRTYKSSEIQAQCPKCSKFWVAEKLGEQITGVFQKRPFILLSFPQITNGQLDIFAFEEAPSVQYERYKAHYKCKHCGYEWLFLGSRKR